jgi:hypothetical protein
MAEEAKVTPLMSKDLAAMPGKEILMIGVEYPPGHVDAIHRHNAQAFVYVLQGSVVMQVRGGKASDPGSRTDLLMKHRMTCTSLDGMPARQNRQS